MGNFGSSSTKSKELSKELERLGKRPEEFQGQIKLKINEEDIRRIGVVVKPSDGLYAGKVARFEINTVHLTMHSVDIPPLPHPNISAHGDVCIEFDRSSLTLALNALLWLLYNPDYSDPFPIRGLRTEDDVRKSLSSWKKK